MIVHEIVLLQYEVTCEAVLIGGEADGLREKLLLFPDVLMAVL